MVIFQWQLPMTRESLLIIFNNITFLYSLNNDSSLTTAIIVKSKLKSKKDNMTGR